jgi:hypothetical protein
VRERSDECCRWNKQDVSIYGLPRGHMKFVPICSYSGTQGRETKGQIGEIRSLRHVAFEIILSLSRDGGRGRTRLVAAPTVGKFPVPCKPLAMRGTESTRRDTSRGMEGFRLASRRA